MSKKLILSLALSGLVLASTAQTTVAPAIPRDEKIEQQIETLLKKMTLDEKVGQMCELTIDLLQKRANPFAGLNPKDITVDDLKKIVKRYKLEKEFKLGKEMPSQEVMMQLYMRIQGIENAKGFQLDEAMLDSVIGKYKVGSILNVPNGVAQSVEKWQEIIKRIQEKSMEVMGIPCVYGVDQIHGTTYTLGGTFFPQGVNMGATFNRELTREGARISAYETKAGSIPWTYAPVTDLGRDPRWPRMWVFEKMCGIKVAGENRFKIAPVPGGHFSHAGMTYDSVYGKVGCSWKKYADGTYAYHILVPSNTTAEVSLPGCKAQTLPAGEYDL